MVSIKATIGEQNANTNYCHDGCAEDRQNGSVFGNSNATYGFAVSGIRRAAEYGADKGTDTVAQKSPMQTGVGQQVFFDDIRNVLMVGKVFGKDDEGNGNV